ncbi:MAG: AAA family ATPase, partial [Chloroflexi bacterium]|nr:AAA family ATPase [Chloroflexota bacterium]
VDAILLGQPIAPELRERGEDGEVRIGMQQPTTQAAETVERRSTPRAPRGPAPGETLRVYPFGMSWTRLEDAARGLGLPVAIVREPEEADVVLTLKNYYRRRTPRLRSAESAGVPVYVSRGNSLSQIASALASVFEMRRSPEEAALGEAREAIAAVVNGDSDEVELAPQNAYMRKLQHELVERANLTSASVGAEPHRRVQVSR